MDFKEVKTKNEKVTGQKISISYYQKQKKEPHPQIPRGNMDLTKVIIPR